jgi:nucleoside-diphosphate-sugar epimerase
LRKSLYSYREKAPSPDHWMARYDKILVEQAIMSQTDLPATILRFPAALGPNEYRLFQRWLKPMLRGDTELRIHDSWSEWRWTHGLAEDVAEAVVLAATHLIAAGSIDNVGESRAPTIAERLAGSAGVAGWGGHIRQVPASELPEADRLPYDFAHHLAYDTTRIRTELGYTEVVPAAEALARMLEEGSARRVRNPGVAVAGVGGL